MSFVNEFELQIAVISDQKLKYLSKRLTAVRKERFRKNESLQCETIERAFTEEEFQKFMDGVENPFHRACFVMMGALGLRVGELLALSGRDLDREELLIDSTKGSYKARFRLPDSILGIIHATEPDDKLFPISDKMLRQAFAKYRKKVGLNRLYMYTKPCGPKNIRNRRYDLTLHSFRHYALQKAYLISKDVDLVRRLARHKHLETTLQYFRKNRKDEVENLLQKMASPKIATIMTNKNLKED